MTTRTRNLDTVLLSLEILRRIPRNRKITAQELHEQLQHAGFTRDLRSIQRHLDTLSEHFDIERDDRTRPYGYRWLARAGGLSLPFLTPQESLLLHLAEEHLKHLLPAPLLKSLDDFFFQARVNLNDPERAKLEKEWTHKVRVVSTTLPLLPPHIAPGVFNTVSQALYENRWLHIDYRNARRQRRRHDIMPLGLAQQGPTLYLVCRFRDFNNERTLAIHRILSAEISDLSFERPADFNLAAYEDEGRFQYGEGRRIRLSFYIDKDAGAHLLESRLAADQTVEETPESYLIRATVLDSLLLDRWLKGFGDAVWGIEKESVE
ncbi:WYL domain-containing protein [Achromobacter sp. F4_2707]|uniref:helix-turn-helix transcriptional regulator n=1 Tax=Achromobacter sp. F4_2707 TaxID=3114286 RepID=UPI0039C71FC5